MFVSLWCCVGLRRVVLCVMLWSKVHDDEKVRIEDLGCNFYLDESDVGKPRGQASSKELADINPNTYFSVHTGEVCSFTRPSYDTINELFITTYLSPCYTPEHNTQNTTTNTTTKHHQKILLRHYVEQSIHFD